MSFLRDSFANQLAGIATRGGEHGPYYDQGVMLVVNQVRATGKFDTSRLDILSSLLNPQILTPEDRATVTDLLAELGMSPQQGADYAAGIKHAHSLLEPYWT